MPTGQGLDQGVQMEQRMEREKSDGNLPHLKEEELVMAPGHIALRTKYSEEACHLAASLFSLVKMISTCLVVLLFVFFFILPNCVSEGFQHLLFYQLLLPAIKALWWAAHSPGVFL